MQRLQRKFSARSRFDSSDSFDFLRDFSVWLKADIDRERDGSQSPRFRSMLRRALPAASSQRQPLENGPGKSSVGSNY